MPRAERPDMADYGVPSHLDGVLPWTWAETRLTGSRNYWLATASPHGRPHTMPVWGVWLPDEEVFVFSCAPSARKSRNLRANPHAVVAVDDTVEVVAVEGTAVERSGEEEAGAIRAYGQKYASEDQRADELAEFIASMGVFRLVPERAFGVIERPDEFGPRATRWVWS